ncbi:HK97 gp10 family phage protein [Massilia sp. UMI-21]|nr:HK97 gp10 family phage protein [Massilia sp. UMI-21]
MADETIAGGRALDALLQTLPVKVEKNILRAAMRAGAAVFREQAKANVPVDSGALRRSLKVSVNTKRGKVTAKLKAGGRLAPHAHLVEFGTKPHKIKPKKQQALAFGGHVAREVDHPGARPQPFMRPAFDGRSTAAIAAVGAKIRERLTSEGIDVPAPEEP